MPLVSTIEVLKPDNKSQYLADLNLAAVPGVNDKIVFDEQGTGYVFNVLEVHFADEGRTDVFVERISTIAEYNARGFA